MSRGAVLALTAALTMAVSACSGSDGDKAGGHSEAASIVLTLAQHDANDGGAEFAALVERRSRGAIRIRVRDGWREDHVDFEGRTVRDVQAGTVDLGIVVARVWDTLGVRSFQGLLAPFLVDSLELERRILEGPTGARMLSGLDGTGVVGIATLPGPLARPFGYVRPLAGLQDYAGARLGLRPGRVEEATLRALGARVRTYTSLNGASRDGAVLNLWAIPPAYRGKTLAANVVFWPRPMTIVMNRKAFEALSSAQREILLDAGRDAVSRRPAEVERLEREALRTICDQRLASLVRLSPSQLSALRAAVRTVYAELERDARTRTSIEEIRNLRVEAASAKTESLRCPAPAATSAPELEGVWRSSVTPAELLAARASRAEAATYSGAATLSLSGGRWVFRGEHTTVTGTYRVRGDGVRLTMVTCTANPCSPGSATTYSWSVYRDTLSLTARPGSAAWPRLVVEPSTRAR